MCTKDNNTTKQNGPSSTSKAIQQGSIDSNGSITTKAGSSSTSSSLSKERAANGDRVRDKNGYRQRAAAFCTRLAFNDGKEENVVVGTEADARFKRTFATSSSCGEMPLEVLLVSGRREGSAENFWVLPGGGVEFMESAEEAVVRELREEAGIQGRVLFPIGKFTDDQRFHHTMLFCLTVLETFDEWENCENGRERRWMSMEQARRCVKPNQMPMFEQSIAAVKSRWMSAIAKMQNQQQKAATSSSDFLIEIFEESNKSSIDSTETPSELINEMPLNAELSSSLSNDDEKNDKKKELNRLSSVSHNAAFIN